MAGENTERNTTSRNPARYESVRSDVGGGKSFGPLVLISVKLDLERLFRSGRGGTYVELFYELSRRAGSSSLS